MKICKRLIAAVMCAALLVMSFAGCHEKGAVVASAEANGKTYSVTSGVYMLSLILADSEGREKVAEQLTEEGKTTTDVDYYKQTIDKKKFADWVRDRADEICREYLYLQTQFDKNKLKFSDSDAESMDSYIAYQWQLSYMYLCEPNSVSFASYEQFEKVYTYQRLTYFKHLYGEGGVKEVSKDNISKALEENFVLANLIQMSTKDSNNKNLSDDKIEEIKTELQGYADKLNAGVSFDVIYEEYESKQEEANEQQSTSSSATSSGSTSSASTSSSASSGATSSGSTSSAATSSSTEEDEPKPLDEKATLLGKEDTSAESELFYDVEEAEIGKATVVEGDGYMLLVNRKDILADPYYLETYNDEILYLLKNEEFLKAIEEGANKLEVKFNSYEQNYLNPKKIDYSVYENYYASMQNQYAY